VRFCISASHSRAQLDEALRRVREVARVVGIVYDAPKKEYSAEELAYCRRLREAPLTVVRESQFKPDAMVPQPVEEQAPVQVPANALDLRKIDPLQWCVKPAPAHLAAAQHALLKFGCGTCGPRGFFGTTDVHLALEKSVAEFLGMEQSIVYSHGVATISSVIPAFASPQDAVFVDAGVAFGVLHGLSLCKASITYYDHTDLTKLDAALAAHAANNPTFDGRRFVVSEALFLNSGALVDLPRLVEVKKRHGAVLILEESLTFGCLGATGRGLTEQAGVKTEDVDMIVGSLEYAIPGIGGFCAGRASIVRHQRLYGAGYCFSAASPTYSVASAVAALKDLAQGAEQPRKLAEVAGQMKKELAALQADGIDVTGDSYIFHITSARDDEQAFLRRVAERAAASPSPLGVQFVTYSPLDTRVRAAKRRQQPGPRPSLRLVCHAGLDARQVQEAVETLRVAVASE